MVNKDENKSVEKETESKTEVKKENDIKPEKNGDEKVENEKNGEEKVENGKSEEGKVVNGKTEEPEKTYGDPSVCFLCGIPSTTKCKVCGLVGFCSDQHQRLHRDIEPLELIMWDGAAAMGPRMGGAPVCLQCLKPAKSDVRCGDCGWPVCGEECQKGHAHQIECPVLAKSKEKVVFENLSEVQDIYRSIVPLRLLMVKNKFPEVWERMSYLMDHNENRMKDAEMWGKYQTSVNQFLKNCGMEFSDEEIDRAVGLLWTNSFACAQGGGQAIFPSFSFASHSCRPNCAHSVFPNKTLALQAKIKIQAGEEFTISYISTLQGMLKRRTKLREKWFFDCSCSRCSDPTELGSHASTLLCQVCLSPDALLLSKDVLDPVAPWYCTKCDLQIRADEVNDIENRIATDMQKIETTSLAGFETMLETAGTELHPNHYLMILLKRHLVGLYSSALDKLQNEDLERVRGYCENIDDCYKIIDPGYQKDRGTVLRALCEVNKMLAKKYMNDGTINDQQFKERVQECVNLFQEAQKCMFVRLKKDPNTVSKYAVVQRKDID